MAARSKGDTLPLGPRLANAVVSMGQYLWHLVFPFDLAAIYPFSGGGIEWAPALASAAAAGAISAAVLRWGGQYRYLVTGWLWFLGTLVPVLGFVQVGSQAWADRYTYVPYVGVFLALVWLIGDAIQSRPALRVPMAAAGAAFTLAFAALAHIQTYTWKDDLSLFGRVAQRFPGA